ncbi:Abi family protein [Pseudomonas amygdali]|uniref:Abortive infection bacteriophage resistance protein n=1 Tax=Pseudomonas amygdali pv. photiniae TaxID=251724 RepID=A0A0P9V4U6_PSEA0|nr:Abi family protein [Pseudomonas amygdali]KPX79110.1 Uncharacterized protein ALO53_00140 [Pseudomonas amygdali pv. photiniae]
MDATPVKPFLDYPELTDILINRKMIVEDVARAARKIEQIGYYHLSGYWYLARSYSLIDGKHKIVHENFRNGTSFNAVFKLYLLDKNLRVEFFNAIERIEIFLRTVIAHEMGRLDPLCYQNKKYFNKKYLPSLEGDCDKDDEGSNCSDWYDKWVKKVEDKVSQSKEQFIIDHKDKAKPIPIWVLVELWDFGMLSKFYSMLKRGHQDKICERFDSIPPDVIENWLFNLNTIRNRCAHHSRLFNGNNPRTLKIPMKGYFNLLALDVKARNKIYGVIAVVDYFLTKISVGSDWVARISETINSLPDLPGLSLTSMGFDADAKSFPIERFRKASQNKQQDQEPDVSAPAKLIEQLLLQAPTEKTENEAFVNLVLTLAQDIEGKRV